MSEIPGGWFHCCHCGTLFKAAADPETRGNCPACGQDPAGAEADQHEHEHQPKGEALVRRKVRKPGGHHHHKPPQKDRKAAKTARRLGYFVAGWVAVVGGAAVMMKRGAPNTPPPSAEEQNQRTGRLSDTDQQLLLARFRECSESINGLLAAPSARARAPYVLRSIESIPRMTRYYEENPEIPDSSKYEVGNANVIKTPAGPAIETIWKKDNGEFLETYFFEEKGAWKLDWDAFVRYGTEAWPQFLVGEGEGEGVFRVLARERVGAAGPSSETLSLVLYQPVRGQPGEARSPSPEIRVLRATALGHAIEDAFAERAAGRSPFGGTAFALDPPDMIRLRVRVRRSGDAERIFEIHELLATHWLEIPETPIKAGS